MVQSLMQTRGRSRGANCASASGNETKQWLSTCFLIPDTYHWIVICFTSSPRGSWQNAQHGRSHKGHLPWRWTQRYTLFPTCSNANFSQLWKFSTSFLWLLLPQWQSLRRDEPCGKKCVCFSYSGTSAGRPKKNLNMGTQRGKMWCQGVPGQA